MNITELAKQAGVAVEVHKGRVGGPWCITYTITPDIERFAALVRAAALEEAARVCEQMQNGWASDDHMTCAAAIRKLKEKT